MRYLFIFIVSLAVVGAVGCSRKNNQYKPDREDFDVHAALSDARSAVQSDDCRLRGVMRFALVIPGARNHSLAFAKRYGVVIIKGTGDVYDIKDPNSYGNRAYRYAKKYNKIILSSEKCPMKVSSGRAAITTNQVNRLDAKTSIAMLTNASTPRTQTASNGDQNPPDDYRRHRL